jgi:hypothetical protein
VDECLRVEVRRVVAHETWYGTTRYECAGWGTEQRHTFPARRPSVGHDRQRTDSRPARPRRR